MASLSALSRRALVAVAALAATAPSTKAREQKPLAFVVATVRSAGLSADATRFEVAVPTEFVHPKSGFTGVTEIQMSIALAPSQPGVRRRTTPSAVPHGGARRYHPAGASQRVPDAQAQQ